MGKRERGVERWKEEGQEGERGRDREEGRKGGGGERGEREGFNLGHNPHCNADIRGSS